MAKSKSLLVSARAISLDWAKRGRCKTRQINEFFSPRWQPSQDPPIHRTHTTNGANESHDPAVHQGRTYIGQNAQDVNAGKRLLNRYKDLRRSKKATVPDSMEHYCQDLQSQGKGSESRCSNAFVGNPATC